MLFRGAGFDTLHACITCGAAKFKRQGSSMVQDKVLRHFHIIPKLRKMFMSLAQAELMRWHMDNWRSDRMVCHAADSA